MNKPAMIVVASILLGGGNIPPASVEAEVEDSPDLHAWVQQNVPDLVAFYRDLHRHPELSFHEENTAALLARTWQSLGATVSKDIGGHGIVGLLKNGDGPTVMLRCDLDGLPVIEETNLAYSSQVRVKNDKGVEVGVMHACGHDAHMTTVTGTARYLAARLVPVFRRVVGADKIVESEMSMSGEDFSRFGKAGIPILMYRVGAVTEQRLARHSQLGQQPPSLHSPLFYPDIDEVLTTGVTSMSAIALELLGKADGRR